MNGDIWAQVQAERRRSGGLSEEDALERAIERRKALYAAGLFAKVSKRRGRSISSCIAEGKVTAYCE